MEGGGLVVIPNFFWVPGTRSKENEKVANKYESPTQTHEGCVGDKVPKVKEREGHRKGNWGQRGWIWTEAGIGFVIGPEVGHDGEKK